MIKMEDMLEIVTVRDVESEAGYSPGIYYNRKPVFGLILRAKKGSFLERLEIKAKGKFKLENDPENYVQEVRFMLCEAIDSYYKKDDASEDDSKAKEWIFKDVSNKLEDLARKTKSVSYYDWDKGEFIINQFDYFEHSEASAEMLENYINNIGVSKMMDGRTEFMKWFEYNKYNVLTRKQISYIDNDNVDTYGKQQRYYMKKAIIKKIDKVYHDKSIKQYKIDKINNKLNLIQEITKCDDMIAVGRKISGLHLNECCEFILDRIYEELSMSDCMELTNVINKNKKINLLMIVKVLQILRLMESELEKRRDCV